MTDHSILTAGAPELPFQREARTLTRVLRLVFVKVPDVVGQALASHDLFEQMGNMSDAKLNELGIARADIPAYIAEKTGILTKKAGS